MLIKLKNKDTLIVDDFKFKCSIGKNGININKKEGDNCTPKGKFKIETIYYRADKVKKPITKIKIKKIKKNMLWCNDPYSKDYNKQIYVNKKNKGEKIVDTNILKTQERIERILGLKVNILNKKNNSGKVTIEYKDLDQFDLISNLLTKH